MNFNLNNFFVIMENPEMALSLIISIIMQTKLLL